MEDHQIIDLFFDRSETAISMTAEKYGRYCHYIAYNILRNEEDSEECVNDTYLRAWNAIPPHRPDNLAAFLGKITRNLALDKCKYGSREKRKQHQPGLSLEELGECILAAKDVEQIISEKELVEQLNRFLEALPKRKRQVFVRRYWYFSSISEIARDFSISQSNVKVMLMRTRKELKHFLEREGVEL